MNDVINMLYNGHKSNNCWGKPSFDRFRTPVMIFIFS